MDDLKKLIREVPDYPKPGILYYDLTTILKDKQGFHNLVDQLCAHYDGRKIDVVAGTEARGFFFAPENRTDSLELYEDAIAPGRRVIICDDLLATGGTAAAAAKLVQ